MNRIRIFLLVSLVVIFTGNVIQNNIKPQPQFPLSEADLTAALEETGLLWDIEETEVRTDRETTVISYSLHIPGIREGYNSVSITSYDSKELGRRLQIYFSEPQNKQYWLEKDDACWEDWREMLVLIARLYGGFEDENEIYRTCSATELSKEEKLLWEGTLTGGYFVMSTANPLKPQRLKLGNVLQFNVYESEAMYLKFWNMVAESH